jgi:hypothetical protein
MMMMSIIVIVIAVIMILYRIVRFVWKVEKTVNTTMTIGYHGVDVIVCFSFLFIVLFLLFGEIIIVDYWDVYFLGGNVSL